MKKFWILPVTALMISCGAATEEAPAAEPTATEEIAPEEVATEEAVSYTHLTLPTNREV